MGGPDATPNLWKQLFSAVRASGGYPGNVMRFKIILLKLLPHIPATNELSTHPLYAHSSKNPPMITLFVYAWLYLHFVIWRWVSMHLVWLQFTAKSRWSPQTNIPSTMITNDNRQIGIFWSNLFCLRMSSLAFWLLDCIILWSLKLFNAKGFIAIRFQPSLLTLCLCPSRKSQHTHTRTPTSQHCVPLMRSANHVRGTSSWTIRTQVLVHSTAGF